MKIKTLLALALLVPLVIGSVAYAGDPTPPDLEPAAEEVSVVTDYHPGELSEQFTLSPDIVERAFGAYGDSWNPEKDGKFSKVKRNPKGTITQVNTPGSYYVNISIPLMYWEDGSYGKIKEVRFCGQSSKGEKTKPVRWEFWEEGTKFLDASVPWPADEKLHCVEKSYTTATMDLRSLLVRVLVDYANISHTFTFKFASAVTHK